MIVTWITSIVALRVPVTGVVVGIGKRIVVVTVTVIGVVTVIVIVVVILTVTATATLIMIVVVVAHFATLQNLYLNVFISFLISR